MTKPDSGRGENLGELIDLMRRLLGPDGCPWDREQTLESLRSYVIEEAFEVVDAIDRGEPAALREELGDLLFQFVFQSELARAKDWFGPNDVITGITEKMKRRHPWVFGNLPVADADAAMREWEAIKAREKKSRGALDGVPVALPSLLRAVRVGEKASSVGYDWPDATGARAKVQEELGELDQAVASGDRAAIEHELGDLLFALASLARKHGIDPEASLRASLDRFSTRFRAVERHVAEEGRTLRECSEAELDRWWEIVKRELRGAGD